MSVATQETLTEHQKEDERSIKEVCDLYAAAVAGETKIDISVQAEMAKLIGLLYGNKKDHVADSAIPFIKIATGALLSAEPKLELARGIRQRIRLDILSHRGFLIRHIVTWSRGYPVAIALFGVVLAIVLGLVALTLAVTLSPVASGNLAMDPRVIICVAFAAFLGGLTSLLTRLREFSLLEDYDPFLLFWNSVVKPLVSVSFALFVAALLSSQLIGISGLNVTGEFRNTAHLWWVIGFLSGFSERFAPDLATRAEALIAKTPQEESGAGRANPDTTKGV